MESQHSGLTLLLSAIVSQDDLCFKQLFKQCYLISAIAVNCGALTAPNGGSVTVKSTTFGAIATYSCNKGFTLIGQSQIQCQANGQWSGPAPSCQGVLMPSYIHV